MAFRLPLIFHLALMFFLSGCFSRLDVTTRVVLSEKNISKIALEDVRQIVVNHATGLGGECTFSKTGANCRFPNIKSGVATDIDTGVWRNGGQYISVHSAITTMLPADRGEILHGEGLPKFHLDWEKWIVNEFSKYVFESKMREVSGYGSIQDF